MRRFRVMSDAHHYFQEHAVQALQKARSMPFGRMKESIAVFARVYHLLAREAAFGFNTRHLADLRIAKRME